MDVEEEEKSSNLLKKKKNPPCYLRNHLCLITLVDLLLKSQSLIGWGHMKIITLSLTLEVQFLQDLIIQLFLKLALKVQLSKGPVIQLLNFQRM